MSDPAARDIRVSHLDFRLGAQKGLLIKNIWSKTGFLVIVHNIFGPLTFQTQQNLEYMPLEPWESRTLDIHIYILFH